MTKAEQSIADVLQNSFDIRADVISAGNGQAETTRFRIESGDKKWLAKHHGPYFESNTSFIEYECAMLEFLAQSDLPVAPNIRTVDGRPFEILDNRPLVVYEWSEGYVEWPTSLAKSRLLGSALAKMHVALDGFSSNIPSPRYDIDRLIERPLELLRPFAESETQYARLCSSVREVLPLVSAIPLDSASFGPIHGDIHQGNCHFASESELTVLDFSLAGIGYRTYDLTGFLWPMRDQTIEDPAMQTACQGFLEGYDQIRPLTSAERDAIPAFVQLRSLWETGNWIEAGTGREQPEEVAKAIPYLIQQFEASFS